MVEHNDSFMSTSGCDGRKRHSIIQGSSRPLKRQKSVDHRARDETQSRPRANSFSAAVSLGLSIGRHSSTALEKDHAPPRFDSEHTPSQPLSLALRPRLRERPDSQRMSKSGRRRLSEAASKINQKVTNLFTSHTLPNRMHEHNQPTTAGQGRRHRSLSHSFAASWPSRRPSRPSLLLAENPPTAPERTSSIEQPMMSNSHLPAPHSTGSGELARQEAARQNNIRRTRSPSRRAYSRAHLPVDADDQSGLDGETPVCNPRSHMRGGGSCSSRPSIIGRITFRKHDSCEESDRESGIDMDTVRPAKAPRITEPVSDIRLDPMSVLPLELIAKILSGLEASSLIALAATSSSWKKAATDPHMLRDVFLRSWQPKITAFCPTTPCGGLGLGKSKSTHPQPATQDWRQMFNARGKLDKNWQEGREWTHYMFGHTDSVYCVQFDENKAITGSRDRTIRVWDLHTHVCIRVIGGPWVYNNDRNKDVLEGDITPQMRLQLECMKDNGYDYLPPRRAYHTPSDWHNASILCLQYDDDILVTGSSDTTIIMWDIKTFQPLRRLRCHNSGVLDLAFDADKIVSCSKDFTICIWDRRTGDLLNRVEGHQGPVNAIQLRGDTFVSASGEGSAHLYKLNYKVQPGLRVHDAPFASCAPELVKSFWSRERGLACIEYSDDGQHILAGGNDHVIFKYDTTADQDQPKAQLAGHDGLVRSLYLDNVNGRIISGSYDLSIRAWDYDSGRLQQTWPDKTTSWILSAKSDYRRLVATSQDGKVVLMDFGANVENVELLEGMARGPQEQTASTNAREAYRQRTWNGRPDPDMLPHYNSKGWEETMMYMVP